MKESSTYQAIVAEGISQGISEGISQGIIRGAIEEARKVLFLLGEKYCGTPSPQVRASIEAITDLARLEELVERALEVSTWEELMAPQGARRRQREAVLLLGYNTNGFAHHRLEDALGILAGLGYRSVAITLDYHCLDPHDSDLPRQIERVRALLRQFGLRSVIETGARFLLSPWHKHQPTLLSADSKERHRRLTFLQQAVDVAHDLGSDAVSFWSGTPRDEADFATHLSRLNEGCLSLCEYAASRRVRLAFEPEPGMLIDTMDRFAELHRQVAHPNFGLTLDIGHLHCQGEVPIAEVLRRWSGLLWNVHIEDMRRGVHDHLMFGEGEIDFGPVLRTLDEIGYAGGVHVELSRHSHDAVETARRALAFLENVPPQ